MDVERLRGRGTEPGAALGLLTAAVTVILLQSFRVFVPYLVFEVDQSERTTLATYGVIVFALAFVGAILVRLAGVRTTLVTGLILMAGSRLALQFIDAPDARWMLGAAAVVASAWVLMVVLPAGGMAHAYGIALGFAIDLAIRSMRDTLDLPWMPGAGADVTAIVLVGIAIAAASFAVSRSQIDSNEATWRGSLHFLGIGSGFALWLVAAGNIGMAELRSGFGLPGSIALIFLGILIAVLATPAASGAGESRIDGRWFSLIFGMAGAGATLIWVTSSLRWLELLAVPVFVGAVTALTMHAAVASAAASTPWRWRTGSLLTVGLLLQTAFVFFYFARSGPMQLYLAPLAVLTFSRLAASRSQARAESQRAWSRPLVTAVGAIALVVVAWSVIDEPVIVATPADSDRVTVMTFNIQEGFSPDNFWSLETTAQLIEAHDPDVVVLQETTRGWLVMSSVDQVRWLAERLDMDFVYGGASHDGLWGNAVLTRLPIDSSETVLFSTTQNLRRGAIAVEVETASGSLLVIGTHLDNLRNGVDTRLEQLGELFAFWRGRGPAIIAGDLNADPDSPEWQVLAGTGFVDAAGDDPATTSEDERRIDYIFVTPDITIESYQVPDVWVSDHRPVVVELTVPT